VVSRTLSPSQVASLESWSSGLVSSLQGVLFEDEYLQVLLRQEFNLHQGTQHTTLYIYI
jgi:hypothetical protein